MTTKEGWISRLPFVLLRLPRRGEGFCVPVKKVFHPREARAASGGPLFPTAGKVGKRAGRNQWFLHFLAHYFLCEFVARCHAFTQGFLFRLVKRIVFAPAPLPLIPTPNNASVPTVETVSGSGARRKSMRHTKRNQPCSADAWYKVKKIYEV